MDKKTYKQLFILSILIAGSFAMTPASAQVHVSVGIGTPPPPVVVYERDYPGYTYYTYPAWNGHYRDRIYYAHYRPVFEREHRAYFHGRSFDHARFEREHHWHERHDRGRGHGGYDHGRNSHSSHGHSSHGHNDHGHAAARHDPYHH